MANGQRYHPQAMVAASWDFPIGSTVRVEDLHNHCFVVVKITDTPAKRFKHKRIDLSPAAFLYLDGLDYGITDVKVQIVAWP